MLRYRVKLRRDTNGTILADFPEVPEAHTFGPDREQALWRATDALETAFLGYLDTRRALPEATPVTRTVCHAASLNGGEARTLFRARRRSWEDRARQTFELPPSADRSPVEPAPCLAV